ncbi:ComA operon protein 2 [Algibacter lectus]|uniref:ComA operon protein 2 n=1 Tax=Algibacter lectus TaxID=221126 RepID=A0A090W6U3_9FLAO|nr:ComA operon protein 2 [Algibacter lectus]
MELSKKAVLEKANLACKNTLMETLRIEMVDFGEDYLTARMPVDSRVHQPMVYCMVVLPQL